MLLNVLKRCYKNSKIFFLLLLFNTMVISFLLWTINEMKSEQLLFLVLLGFAPSLMFLFLIILSSLLKNKEVFLRVMKIISYILIIPYLLYLMFVFFVYIALFSDNPEVSLDSYRYNKEINYFPKNIPNNYVDAKYYHKYPFMQGGEEIILYLKLDDERFLEYKNNLDNKNLERNKEMVDIKSKFYCNTPYEKGITDQFTLYTIESKCDKSGYCNHGLDKHILINEEEKEIIFYYQNW